MSGFDFDDIVALWKEPEAGDQAMIQALAKKARRQARLIGYLDAALAVIVVVAVLFGTIMKPTPAAAAAAVMVTALIFWITWKRRSFRQMSRSLDTTGRQAFLESSIRSATVNLRRATFTLATFGPAILFGLFYRVSTRDDPEFRHPIESVVAWITTPRGILVMVVLALLFAWGIRSWLRAKAELRRWRELRDAYDEEAAGTLDGP
jgi:hypothetical protein